MNLFEDPVLRRSFPAPIASSIEVLVSEIEESGVAATADATSALIEETFRWLGCIWVAEYLALAERAEAKLADDLNEFLLETLAAGRSPLTGQWVALSREIREHFVAADEDSIMVGLVEVDFGEFGDEQSPVSRLMRFRNHFSHGSFHSAVAEIEEHQQLMHRLLKRLPCLREQGVVVMEIDSGVHYLANGNWEETSVPEGEPLPPAQPVILGRDGLRLNLYPMLQLLNRDGGVRSLSHSVDRKSHAELFRRSGLSVWLERYENERGGRLPYDSVPNERELPEVVVDELREALTDLEPSSVLVEAHPGCGGGLAVTVLGSLDGLGAFDAVGRVAVRHGHLGQSGFTVAQMVLRLIEDVLGKEDGHYQAELTTLLRKNGSMSTALADLAESGKRVLLGIEGLHDGVEAYREESVTVVEVYEFLVGSPLWMVASIVPGILQRPVYDRRIRFPEDLEPNLEVLVTWIRRLCGGELHRGIMEVLVARNDPVDLFEICDDLDNRNPDAPSIFEPAVERALWDLRPLLAWKREERKIEGKTENVRLWEIFSPAVSLALVDESIDRL